MNIIPGPEWGAVVEPVTYIAIGGIGLIVTFALGFASKEFFDLHPVADKILLVLAVGMAVSMGIVL